MSREPEFLIAAVRRFLHPDASVPDGSGIDWSRVLRLARAHAVMPALCMALEDAPLPASVRQELRSVFESSSRRSLTQSGQIVRLAGLLQENGIQPVSLKGPLLSQFLYGGLGMRSSGDIDLLVRPADAMRVRDLLAQAGYRTVSTLHWDADSAYLRSRESEISFTDATGTESVDIHWRIAPPYFASPFDGKDAWPSLTTVTLAGRQVQTLAPEHLLLLLCSHGAKHAFERLGWICDIASLLKVCPDLDWPAVVAQTARTHTSRQLWLGVRLAVDLLDAPRPSGMPDDPQVQPLTRLVTDRLLAGVTTPMPSRELIRFSMQVLETPGQRLRFLAGNFLTPSEAEFRVLRLPPPMFFLYYPFRSIRLVARSAFHLVRGGPQAVAGGCSE